MDNIITTDEEILQKLFDVASDDEQVQDILEHDLDHEDDFYDSDKDLEYVPGRDSTLEGDEEVVLGPIREIEDVNLLLEIARPSKEKRTTREKTRKRKIIELETNANVDFVINVDGDELRGKNGFLWKTKECCNPQNKTPARNIDHIRPGLTGKTINITDPAECFRSFFSQDILEKMLVHTNEQISLQRELYKKCNDATLNDMCMEELEALLGILILAASLKDNHLTTEVLFDPSFCGERYRATFSERRFKFLLNCLRFDDRATREERIKENKLAPISEIWFMFLKNCRENYKPGSYVTIDDQLLGFRGNCPFRMYIPSKPESYGIKIVMACDSGTKYMSDAIVYTGKGTVPAGVGAGEYFVLELTKSFRGTWRNITTDNWFSSIPLAQKLFNKNKLTTIGTLKSNTRELPQEFTDVKFKNRKTESSLFLFADNLTAVSYKRKQNKLVILQSTMHGTGGIDESTRKPEIILVYNQTKGCVDAFDQMAKNMNCCRKTRRWPMCFFYNMINMACINSFIIYAHNIYNQHKKPLQRIKFMFALHKTLTEPWQKMRLDSISRMNNNLRRSILLALGQKEDRPIPVNEKQQGSRTYCRFCHYSKKRMTVVYCSCGRAICGEHQKKICPECYE